MRDLHGADHPDVTRGIFARIKGWPLSRNPHAPGSTRYKLWLAGWLREDAMIASRHA